MKRITAIALALILCLSLLPSAALAAYEAEPNDDYRTATRISPNETAGGSWADSQDLDWYVVTLPSQGRLELNFELSADVPVEVHVSCVDASGSLKEIYVQDISGLDNPVNSTRKETCDALYLPAGTYYIYTYSYADAPGSYSITPSFTACGQSELEPNSTYKTATAITANRTIQASFASGDFSGSSVYDEDWYKIHCTRDTALKFFFQLPIKYNVEVHVSRVGSNGALEEIYYKNLWQDDSVTGRFTGTTEDIGVTAGDYYIEVLGDKDAEYCAGNSEYTMTAKDLVNEPSEWAAGEVKSAVSAGLVPQNLQYNYGLPISRGNAAQMFVNLIESVSGTTIDRFLAAKGASINENAFTDTSDKAVLAANALGIIRGVGDGRFNPTGTLTRAQIAAILNRTAGVLGVTTSGYSHSFTDVSGHWVDSELGWPVHAGIINGVGDQKFNPDGQLTTEQAIAIVYRAEKYLKK